MDAMDNRACGAEKRFSGFATRTMKRTIARDAKPVERFWRIAVYPDYWERTGRARSKSSTRSRNGRSESASRFLYLSALPLEKVGFSIVPLILNGHVNLPSTSLPPDRRPNMLVNMHCLGEICATLRYSIPAEHATLTFAYPSV